MKKLSGVFLLLMVLSLLVGPARGEAAATFVAARSGRWEDPRTWGHSGLPRPDVTIPGPSSNVTIPTGVLVTLAQAEARVASLTVQSGAVLQAQTGGSVRLIAQDDIINDGTILASPGTKLAPAGGIILESLNGRIVNQGLIRGGDAGEFGGPGGFIYIRALTGEVENWGLIEGGDGAAGFARGWVRVGAAGVIRHRGELRGGDVLLAGTTVAVARGRVIAGRRDDTAYGDVLVTASQAALVGTRATRISGQGMFLVVGRDGVIDAQDMEDMALLGRDRGVWLVGGAGARLYLTGNRNRFAPIQALAGSVHIWIDPANRFLDSGVSLADLIVGNLDQGPGQTVALPRLLLRRWEAGPPGARVSWAIEIVNQGNAAQSFTLSAQDTLGWPITLSTTQLPRLAPGESAIVTATVDIPTTAHVGQANLLTFRLNDGCCIVEQDLSVPLPVRPWTSRLPWLGHRGTMATTSEPTTTQAPSTIQVGLTWPGAGEGQPVHGRSLLVMTVPTTDEVVAADLSYWDGTHWVPIATTVDMENFVEDGVWVAIWDTTQVPLTSALVRARAWTRAGSMGQATRQIPIEHEPVAQATAEFLSTTTVRLDGTPSYDLDGSIVNYTWDLGDGTTGYGTVVEHTYSPGRYTVRLTVTDEAGLTDEAVYVLDTTQQTWQEQESCGCASATLVNAGLAPLPLPWEDATHQSLGPDMELLASGRMLRVNLALEATLTPDSNPLACRVEQAARGTWTPDASSGRRSQNWQWNGQEFPASGGSRWGLVGYTQPSSLMQARGREIRWVISPGWGWRIPERGLPLSFFSGPDARLDMTYRARIEGDQGSCSCTWQVTITANAGQPQVTITGGC